MNDLHLANIIENVIFLVVGWILGLLTSTIAKDGIAQEKCLYKLNDLRRVLENPHSIEQLIQAKLLIESLNIDQMALLVPSYHLKDLISQSFTIFSKFNPYHEDPTCDVTSTCIKLTITWNATRSGSSESQQIEKIQVFIEKHFLTRLWRNLFSIIPRYCHRKATSRE